MPNQFLRFEMQPCREVRIYGPPFAEVCPEARADFFTIYGVVRANDEFGISPDEAMVEDAKIELPLALFDVVEKDQARKALKMLELANDLLDLKDLLLPKEKGDSPEDESIKEAAIPA